VASFINQTKKMSSSEAEELVEQQAQTFEDNKDYLIRVWDEGVKTHSKDKEVATSLRGDTR